MKRECEYLSELDTRKLKGPVRAAILLSPFGFYSAHLGREIWVPVDFVTNFASVPRLPFAYWLFGGVADEAAVIHDYLYGRNLPDVSRKQADEVFAEAMKACGTAAWRRGPMWFGVRLFGGSHYQPQVKIAENPV